MVYVIYNTFDIHILNILNLVLPQFAHVRLSFNTPRDFLSSHLTTQTAALSKFFSVDLFFST